MFSSTSRELTRRYRQINKILRSEGIHGLANRVREYAAEQIRPSQTRWLVGPADVVAAHIERLPEYKNRKRDLNDPITVNWVVGPASAGSGGHTTLYRIIRYLDLAGYNNNVYFYNPFKADLKYYEKIARESYGVKCNIASIDSGMADADAVFATSWDTAYPVFNASCAGKRFYFIQDYEPYFYPVGANSVLAENTYRMGFHGVTAGRWLTEKLRAEFGMQADFFPFGCDTKAYGRDASVKRNGVAFYARAQTARRGVEIGILALSVFAERNPDIDIHVYGQNAGSLPFKFIDHGLVNPKQLNQIYNQCFAGLTLSLTNASLVPVEMLAAGCIPVVNDAAHNRIVIDNPHVRYAATTPHALAAELEAIVRSERFEDISRRASESVQSISWDTSGEAVDTAIRRALGEGETKGRPCQMAESRVGLS